MDSHPKLARQHRTFASGVMTFRVFKEEGNKDVGAASKIVQAHCRRDDVMCPSEGTLKVRERQVTRQVQFSDEFERARNFL